MLIKNLLRRVAEKLTGRKCPGCKHNKCNRCTHPDPAMFDRCFSSITKPGFMGKYESPSASYAEAVAVGEALKNGFDSGVAATRAKNAKHDLSLQFAEGVTDGLTKPMTPEEEYQFQKIQAALEEAGEIARESGLLED